MKFHLTPRSFFRFFLKVFYFQISFSIRLFCLFINPACGISLIAFCRKIRNITFFNSKIWQDILKNTTYHRCSYCPSIIDSFRIMNNTQSQYLRIFCRCKSQKRGNITICTSWQCLGSGSFPSDGISFNFCIFPEP